MSSSFTGIQGLLHAGSGVAIRGVQRRYLHLIIAHIRGLITPLETTHEPASKGFQGGRGFLYRIKTAKLIKVFYEF